MATILPPTDVPSPDRPAPATVLGAALALAVIAAIGIGAVPISPVQSISILLDGIGVSLPIPFGEHQATVLWSIRLPRVVFAGLIGAALGMAGAALQGVFRNPLADPGVVGVSSGASLAAVAMIVGVKALHLPAFLAGYELPLVAFAGGLAAAVLVYRLATTSGRTSVAALLLCGIAVNALAEAGRGLLIFSATDDQLRSVSFWSLGSLAGGTWKTVPLVLPFVAIAVFTLPRLGLRLNLLLLGEAEAGHLGVDVERVRRTVLAVSALAVGAAVAFSGTIFFVGLIVPHVLRLALGPDNRRLIPCAALLGALLLIAADTLARTVLAPTELPIGVLTALGGAPVFLWLFLKERRNGHIA